MSSGDNLNIDETVNNNTLNNNVKVDSVNIGTVDIPGRALTAAAGAIANGGIMTAALSVGAKAAQSTPSIAGKIALAAGSVALGASAIVVKNIASNVYITPGTNNLMPLNINIDPTTYLTEYLGLTGNNITDLLLLLQFFHNLEKYFSMLILFYFLIINLKDFFLKISTYLPSSISPYYNKSINYIHKAGHVYIFLLLLLLITSLLISSHYFDFFLDNFDKISEHYIKHKK